MRILLAFRVFFAVLFSRKAAERVAPALKGELVPAPILEPPLEKPAPKPPKPSRSEAVTLLAALQREARFLDFIKEPLDGYSDAQVGAAARGVHRDCGIVIDRMFAVAPLLDQSEQTQLEVPVGFDSGKYHLTGNVTGQPPFKGSLVHPGWLATRCEVPRWSGSDQAANVIAPAEVELP
ncbi:MAG: DUF2760 domain-containing protein [Thermoguttaceae bacterium]